MLLSFGIVMICALIGGEIASKLHLPRLLGMLIAGIILGNLNLLDPSFLALSADLRQLALIIILTRAGLNLDVEALKKAGVSALLLCFIPACLEVLGVMLCAVYFLHFSYIEGALMGSVLAAVSPAVIVPKMLKIQEEGYGNNKGIPQMIMAAASVDDIFVIVLFQAFLSLSTNHTVSYMSFVNIPVSIILGILIGIGCGIVFSNLSIRIKRRENEKVILFLCVSILLVSLEKSMTAFSFSAMLAIMSMGATYRILHKEDATCVSSKYAQLWSGAELWLFALVGACVKVEYLLQGSLILVIILLIGLLWRSLGTITCVSFSKLNKNEKIFCMFSYLPKATVQAAIGSIPFSLGLSVGQTILSVAVLAILITAPLGALLIEKSYRKLLVK